MIALNELRIGNWVYETRSCSKRPTQVDSISDGIEPLIDISVSSDRDDCCFIEGTSIEDIDPIPLTTEILEKAGFEKFKQVKGAYSEWKLEQYRFHFREDTVLAPANCFGIQNVAVRHKSVDYFNWNTKYVHQLQNLWFALTGKELNIKKI